MQNPQDRVEGLDREYSIIRENDSRLDKGRERVAARRPKVTIVNRRRRVFGVKSDDSPLAYTTKLTIINGQLAGTCFDETGEDCKGFKFVGLCYHLTATVDREAALDARRSARRAA